MVGGSEGDIEEILERNRRKSPSSEKKSELKDSESFGVFEYREYTYHIEILKDSEEIVSVRKGNDRQFWNVFEDITLAEYPLWRSIRRNYDWESSFNANDVKPAELESLTDTEGFVSDEYRDEAKELLDYSSRTFFSSAE